MKKKDKFPKSFSELKAQDKDEFTELWLRCFKTKPVKQNHQLYRALWFKVQCKLHNLHIEQKHITKLNKYSKDPDKYIDKSYKAKYHLKNGMEIVKTYKGRSYRVLVKSQKEYIYNGDVYNSISAAAKAICHKKVSGYDFFGLNNSHLKGQQQTTRSVVRSD